MFSHDVPDGEAAPVLPARDLEACASADQAYAQVGLESHPKNSVKRASVFSAWGAQFDGTVRCVAMDRTKLVALCAVTARIAASRLCSERLLQKLLGLWAFVFQFR